MVCSSEIEAYAAEDACEGGRHQHPFLASVWKGSPLTWRRQKEGPLEIGAWLDFLGEGLTVSAVAMDQEDWPAAACACQAMDREDCSPAPPRVCRAKGFLAEGQLPEALSMTDFIESNPGGSCCGTARRYGSFLMHSTLEQETDSDREEAWN